ncbi:helix-turn-helix domain-containing protein [Spongiibacter sp. KMU-166]|uniref:Helix-turn-helix domain-containing protein n=1 Tax=Spongiibacter thalassae TaxID=2721624 RepID=A0ABX1GEN7_9GAMM|nr:Cro/CI family transcriptional regulator [Spongiibacter thalassae]NKI17415.1 helix-turn-helix domain-containing protein [Spongiibacter thalassae]
MTLDEYVSQERGLQSSIAKALNITPVLISQWANGARRVPGERCVAIEEATKGAVTRYDLRPDIFGEPEQAA